MPLSQQRILIIGGSNGMGLAAARSLAALNAEVLIAVVPREARCRTVQHPGTRCRYVADFTTPTSCSSCFQRVGRIDHLVLAASANAAWGPSGIHVDIGLARCA